MNMVKLRKATPLRKSVKKSGKADKFAAVETKPVKICPKCGSLHTLPTSIHMATFAGQKVCEPFQYRCETCGYIDSIFPEVDYKDLEHFRENLQKVPVERRMHRTVRRYAGHSGRFKIIGFIFLIVGLLLVYINITRNNITRNADLMVLLGAILFVAIGLFAIVVSILYRKN